MRMRRSGRLHPHRTRHESTNHSPHVNHSPHPQSRTTRLPRPPLEEVTQTVVLGWHWPALAAAVEVAAAVVVAT
eukprot:CAMPEP_0181211008 /NCGR_PEP_ID=MMETSP1096-20121128/23551_1 /TAXON_ID=156174 ORGANISM="Chrysochromulina ericina, Strain CCMP281" /NCGR_SAMPLE_ID=MMETSP1096 /ASSEMBLY_ACC=CAM_ASM_000453 /LENGTH=73 /DNA_ID=CAMNT_0023302369 /DNA_START=1042 /DNA_END=1259 /DNA_ORIENTATION=-